MVVDDACFLEFLGPLQVLPYPRHLLFVHEFLCLYYLLHLLQISFLFDIIICLLNLEGRLLNIQLYQVFNVLLGELHGLELVEWVPQFVLNKTELVAVVDLIERVIIYTLNGGVLNLLRIVQLVDHGCRPRILYFSSCQVFEFLPFLR